jgi:hypothetical protein
MRFLGSILVQEDRDAAVALALSCASYRIDEDDEDYLDGAQSCFNCRYRRWLAEGFSCAKDFPPGIPGGR